LVLGLATALIHLYLNVLLGKFDLLFTLNGLGYLGLLGAFSLDLPFFRDRKPLVIYALMGYTALTILAWVAVGARDALGFGTKAIEVLLILALFSYSRRGASPAP
jgi:ABC-type microcin C transport system permease subunit YejB